MTSEILEDIKKEIMDKLPKNAQVSKVEFEGPEVVLYTKNPEIITDNGDLIRSLAKELRKRI
jgi:predicted metal-dependent RNase